MYGFEGEWGELVQWDWVGSQLWMARLDAEFSLDQRPGGCSESMWIQTMMV
ncbi:hypothetical protein SAMN05444064_11865 [Pseudomonas syringae]|nr:hypothetical protein SAMN05444514_11865 [Pseudomonas syringae]SFM47469.1 hypothetical protein SAMN05444064_11865 [Pseudomonas syringae]